MITVKYSCKRCGLSDRECIVPARESPHDDVKEYVETVVAVCVGEDHARTSPACASTLMSKLMIPRNAEDPDYWIGKAPGARHRPNSPP